MNPLPRVIDRIKEEEGFRGAPYDDPQGIPTIGYGTKLPLTREGAQDLLLLRLNWMLEEMDERWPWMDDMPRAAQRVVQDMAYNMGVPRLGGFRRMLSAMRDEEWERAADELLDSDYARNDVPGRAEENAELLRSLA